MENRFTLQSLEERSLAAADIELRGGPNGDVAIVNGDTSPSFADNTNLGTVTLGAPTADWDFRIGNTGDEALNILSNPRVQITGANASDFSITSQPTSSSVTAGANVRFTVRFNPTAAGERNATIVVNSNDPDEPVYTIAIRGTGAAAPLRGAVEDADFTIGYDTLFSQTHEGGTSGAPLLVTAVAQGQLLKNGSPVVIGTTTVAPGESLVWRPPTNAIRTQNAFTLRDTSGGAAVGPDLRIRVELAAAVDAPSGTLSDVSVNSGASPTIVDLNSMVNTPDVNGTIIQLNTTLGVITVRLFDDVAPTTVRNFLNYVNSSRYNGTVFHRSVSGFVIQGGGFTPPGNAIQTDPTIINEFNFSSLRGTLAMAKVGNNPNSADSQFFINLGDNAGNLDNQNGGFTVFGEVIGTGLTVVDQIAAQPTFNRAVDNSAFTNLPLRNYRAADGLPDPGDYMSINTARVVRKVNFTASSSNSALVTPTVDADGRLTLTY
ncbi:MAG: peptidylprolyl isomerase, partial [Planctomycetia bacterium]